MARKITPERREQRKRLLALLQDAGVNDVEGVQELFKEMVGAVLENGLEGELDEELGYSKYDYRNKKTDNSRNGYSEKTLKTILGDLELSIPRDRKGEFEPQLVKKNQTSLSGDIEEKILSMYAKGMSTGDIESHIRDIRSVRFRHHHQPRDRQDTAGGEGMAGKTIREHLRYSISGRHTLPRPQ